MSERRKTPLDLETIPAQQCSVQLRLEILGRVPFFSGLTRENLEAINRSFRERGYLPGETIYFTGDPAARFYVVADGRVKLLRHTAGGKDVLLDMLTPGEFFGSLELSGEGEHAETAQAHTAACVLSIEQSDFRQIPGRFPAVGLAILDIMNQRLKAAHELVRQLSAHSAERRIAYILLRLGDKLGKPRKVGLLIEVPLSRDDLAQMAGTTTETASRVLSQFQKDGLIDSGRQWVAITNREQLAGLALDELS